MTDVERRGLQPDVEARARQTGPGAAANDGPSRLNLADVYRGIFPFVGALAVAIMAVIFLPDLITWLPDLMSG